MIIMIYNYSAFKPSFNHFKPFKTLKPIKHASNHFKPLNGLNPLYCTIQCNRTFVRNLPYSTPEHLLEKIQIDLLFPLCSLSRKPCLNLFKPL